MNRRIGIGILLAVVGIGLMVVGFFALSGFIRQTLAPPPAPTAVAPITEKVVIAIRDIALGEQLHEEDLALLDVPVELAPRNALINIETAVGRITKVPLITGELVLAHHLADPAHVANDLAFTMEEGTILMAFPVSDLMSGLNVIQRGDIVDILASVAVEIEKDPASMRPGSTEEPVVQRVYTFDAMQRVGVTAMVVDIIVTDQDEPVAGLAQGGTVDGTPQPTAAPQNNRPRAYLLALNPQDAIVLKHLRDINAIFDIVLRSPTSEDLYDLEPVFSEYIIDLYQFDVSLDEP